MQFSSRLPRHLDPNPFSRLLAEKRAKGERILDLTQSNPTLAGFSVDPWDGIDLGGGGRAYQPSPIGSEEARAAIADYYRGSGHGPVDRDDLLLTASTSEAYAFVLKLLSEPGDEILVPAPSYPLFDFLAAMEKVRVGRYPLRPATNGAWQIDFQHLEEEISRATKAIVVVNPNNPTGSYLGCDEAGRLTEICRRHRLALLVDEVFLDYPHPEHAGQHHSAVGLKEVLTFVMSGFSKILALPQVKLGWIHIAGPEPLKSEAQKRLEFIADTYLSVNSMIQAAARPLLSRREEIQKEIKERIAANEAHLSTFGIAALPRQGGWYAVPTLPPGVNDDRICQDLLEKFSLLVHPGYFYDFAESDRLVVSLITPEREFAAGLQHLSHYLRQGGR
jgi:hypothetical protein